jgi:5-(carboxyamino)imidazole ribonucleotide synthase
MLIRPGRTIGIFGGGQLGRMFTLAAHGLGYRVHVLDPTRDGPAAQVADRQINADFSDLAAARALADAADVLTFEFENVPPATLAAAAEIKPVRPAPFVLEICRSRPREKQALVSHGFAVAPHRMVDSAEALRQAIVQIGLPAILKTANSGYDGKGQILIEHPAQCAAAFAQMGQPAGVVETAIEFEKEISVLVARGVSGEVAAYAPFENEHRNHILDVSTWPADIAAELSSQATVLARRIAAALGVVGLLCVEMFVCGDGSLIVNELAPRPHNSAHLTIEAAVTSQFEQQLRAICGLALGDCSQSQPAAMANLLGDLWQNGEPRWDRALAVPGVHLHLYGKAKSKPNRKMGHLTATAPTADQARQRVLAARAALTVAHE